MRIFVIFSSYLVIDFSAEYFSKTVFFSSFSNSPGSFNKFDAGKANLFKTKFSKTTFARYWIKATEH